MRSCTSFIATEMVRYAESKAIFKFVVIGIQPPITPNGKEEMHTPKSKTIMDTTTAYSTASSVATISSTPTNEKCLLLHLLSWETSMAWRSSHQNHTTSTWIDTTTTTTTITTSTEHDNDDDHGEYGDGFQHQRQNQYRHLHFQRVAKVVFEESTVSSLSESSLGDNNKHWISGGGGGVDDIMVDWCDCSNDNNTSQSNDRFSQRNQIRPDLFLPSKTPKSSYDFTRATTTMSNYDGNRPRNNNNKSKSADSTFRLEVSCHELDQVLEDLQQYQCMMSKSYEQATILMKMGQNRSTLGLSMIPL
jgi:hypothetical protein